MTASNEAKAGDWQKRAEEYLEKTRRYFQGPCLIPKPGKDLPSCHENDFCQCEVEAAYLGGVQAGIEAAAHHIDCHKEHCDCRAREFADEIRALAPKG